jgi:hypothetical protein
LLPVRSVFSDEKKLSIAALSHTLPDRLIEQTTPLSAIRRWNCSLVYWLPRSECSGASGLPLSPDRHHQRIGDQLRRHGGAHRPAHHDSHPEPMPPESGTR